jgi:hypothetical protein
MEFIIMGSFITNLHVRDADRIAIIEALRSIGVVPAYVRGSPETRWTSIFPEAGDQDDTALPKMAHALSGALKRPVIAFIVHDSDVLLYWLCDEGKELDRYNSAPGYFTDQETPPDGGNPEALMVYCQPGRLLSLLHPEKSAPEPPAPTKSDPDAMKDAVRKTLRLSYPAFAAKMPNPPSLEEFLAEAEKRWAERSAAAESAPPATEEFVFAEHRLAELAKILGIPSRPAIDSYCYLVDGEGSPGSLTLVRAEGEELIHLE